MAGPNVARSGLLGVARTGGGPQEVVEGFDVLDRRDGDTCGGELVVELMGDPGAGLYVAGRFGPIKQGRQCPQAGADRAGQIEVLAQVEIVSGLVPALPAARTARPFRICHDPSGLDRKGRDIDSCGMSATSPPKNRTPIPF